MKKWNEYSFEELVNLLVKQPFKGTLFVMDPGETTGWCVFQDQKLIEAGQATTKPISEGSRWLNQIFLKYHPTFVVYEAYRVYAWKTQSHAQSDLHTPQFIGTILTYCDMYGVPYHSHMASAAKGFTTDEKLELWGFYKPGLKHARDALRHACYFQLHSYQKWLDNQKTKK